MTFQEDDIYELEGQISDLKQELAKFRAALEKIAEAKHVNYSSENVCSSGNYDDAFEMGVEQGEWYAATIALEALGRPFPEDDDE